MFVSSHLSSSLVGRAANLPSFPTRRSSDLSGDRRTVGRVQGRGTHRRARVGTGQPLLRGWEQYWRSRWRSEFRLRAAPDRKSTCLNSSHRTISYAVFCLKKKKKV